MGNTQHLLLTTGEAAELLRISKTHLERLQKNKAAGLPEPRRLGRRVLWPREALERFANGDNDGDTGRAA